MPQPELISANQLMTEFGLSQTELGYIPAGYRQNSSGHLVPEAVIDPLDLLRDDTVKRIIADGINAQSELKAFKAKAMDDIAAFLDLAAEQYGVKMGGRKGNLSLVSYDGALKIQIAVSDHLNFDERLQIAKQLVDECIHIWAKDANSNIKALVEHAFQTDKKGKISTSRIFGLMRLKIDDELWQKAMQALKDSIQIVSTSEYIRLYQRDDSNEGRDSYQQIVLDIAGL